MSINTLFLRLEGPLQSWGNQESKFVIRRTAEAPTKSGIIGLLCAALGVSRSQASSDWIPRLSGLMVGVRVDRPGVRWWDYHTVGAKLQMRTAEGGSKLGALLSRREYLCDASFLVALQGEENLITELEQALKKPKWTLYLGRKTCVPSRPILECPSGDFEDLLSALVSIPWRKRLKKDSDLPQGVKCFLDWIPTPTQPEAPKDALVWYDVPLTFEPPAHRPRYVISKDLMVGRDGEIKIAENSDQSHTPSPPRPRANYTNSEYKKARKQRLRTDEDLCVFCKSPATTVQHVTYRRAGGNEEQEDLRSLCRLCHDSVTMIEYGHGMGIDRIDPCDPYWRDQIIEKRAEIINFRSLETRRRRLNAEEVE